MENTILGTRIRQRRRELGMTQADLARSVEISPSYLNLIEWNKRRIAGRLLLKVAEALDLSLDELDDVSEHRLFGNLTEIAHLPTLASLGIEENRTSEFIGRFPGWAKGMAALARSEREATIHAQTLADRLSNDPFLNETIHRMLTRIASIRSAAEILTQYPDVETDRKERFNHIIHDESRVLSEVGEALVSYLDKADETDRILTPIDEVEALFEVRQNRFQEIEVATHDLLSLLTDPQPISRRAKALDLVETRLGHIIKTIIEEQPEVKTAAAKARAFSALTDYAVGAILMPMSVFAEKAADLRYDVEALAEAFSTEFEAVCHRLTALPREEATPRFGYFRANAAGTVIEAHSLEGLIVPRYAAACPLWILFRAQQSPEMVLRQRTLFPSGQRFVFLAHARNQGTAGFGKPRHYVTDVLAMNEDDAHQTIYAPEPSSLVEKLGPSCRLCPRPDCLHRVEDPLAA